MTDSMSSEDVTGRLDNEEGDFWVLFCKLLPV